MSTQAYHAARLRAARFRGSGDRRALVTGVDRATWLQGLVTNDVLALHPGHGCYAAFLTPQGRMLADVRILHLGDTFMLGLPGPAADALLTRLEQYIIMEDVAVNDVSARLGLLSVHGPAAAAIVAGVLGPDERLRDALVSLPEHHAVLVQGGGIADIERGAGVMGVADAVLAVASRDYGVPGFDLCTGAARADSLDAAFSAEEVPALTEDDRAALRIEAGRPVFGADLTTDTIPLEAGIEERAISFTKGCYVGQEVVVRVRDRGHGRVARRLVGLVARGTGDATSAIEAGDTMRRDGRDTGRVTSAAWSPALDAWVALGYVGRDDAEGGTIVHVERASRTVALEVRPLPLVPPAPRTGAQARAPAPPLADGRSPTGER